MSRCQSWSGRSTRKKPGRRRRGASGILCMHDPLRRVMFPKEIGDELIDQLLAGREGPESITGPDGLLKQLTKRVVERAASAELTDHLGYTGLCPRVHQPGERDR